MLQKEACEKYQILLKKEKKKGEKMPKKDIKPLLNKRKKKGFGIIRNAIKVFVRNKRRS